LLPLTKHELPTCQPNEPTYQRLRRLELNQPQCAQQLAWRSRKSKARPVTTWVFGEGFRKSRRELKRRQHAMSAHNLTGLFPLIPPWTASTCVRVSKYSMCRFQINGPSSLLGSGILIKLDPKSISRTEKRTLNLILTYPREPQLNPSVVFYGDRVHLFSST
jgi:hypothetical protein